MKVVAMHQPHYFPWLGYLDKMVKTDEFVVLDEVQFTDGSPMHRNRFLQINGDAKLLSVSVQKKGYLEKSTKDVRLSNWPKIRKKHRGFIECNYGKTPYFDEVMPLVSEVLEVDYDTLLDLDMASVGMLRSAYGIETSLVMQSSLSYDLEARTTNWCWDFAKPAKPVCTFRVGARGRTWTTGRFLRRVSRCSTRYSPIRNTRSTARTSLSRISRRSTCSSSAVSMAPVISSIAI